MNRLRVFLPFSQLVPNSHKTRFPFVCGNEAHLHVYPLLKCLSTPPLGFVHSSPSLFGILGRPSRVEPIQLSVPGNVEQKPSMTGSTVRKKKSIGIRALSPKQRKEDHIRALLKEHLSEIRALLRRDVPVPVEVRKIY